MWGLLLISEHPCVNQKLPLLSKYPRERANLREGGFGLVHGFKVFGLSWQLAVDLMAVRKPRRKCLYQLAFFFPSLFHHLTIKIICHGSCYLPQIPLRCGPRSPSLTTGFNIFGHCWAAEGTLSTKEATAVLIVSRSTWNPGCRGRLNTSSLSLLELFKLSLKC